MNEWNRKYEQLFVIGVSVHGEHLMGLCWDILKLETILHVVMVFIWCSDFVGCLNLFA